MLFKFGATGAAALSMIAALTMSTAAQAATYVDSALSDLKPEEKVTAANPQPVQLLFTFKTKGAANPRATKILKDKVVAAVKDSGLFTEVSDQPRPNGAILSIAIDDTADTAAAAQQGFMTGLTFGLKGSVVADNYEAVAEYVGGPTATKITKIQHHKLITTIGLTDPPPNAIKADNGNEAAFIMVRQVVSHDLNDIAKDPAFAGAPPAEAAPPIAPALQVEAPVAPAAAATSPVAATQ